MYFGSDFNHLEKTNFIIYVKTVGENKISYFTYTEKTVLLKD